MQENGFVEQRSKQIMTILQNGVMAIGKNGSIIYANPSMCRYLEKEDLTTTSIAGIMSDNVRPENDAFFESILDVVYNKTQHNQTKVKYTTPTDKRYSFHMTTSFLSGDEDCVIITLADETLQEIAMQKKHDATLTLIGAVMILCLCNLATGIFQYFDNPFPKECVSRLSEILALGLFFMMLRFSSFSMQDIGIKPLKPLRELRETVIIAILLFAIPVALKLIMQRMGIGPFDPSKPFFDWARPGEFYIQYIFIAVFQEFLANCVLQENLNRVLTIKHGKLLALIVSSFMFMALHLHLKLIYMLGAGVLKFALGMLYNRNRSIIGLSFLHYEFGIVAKILQWT